MSDLACHCGRRGALFAKKDHTLVRWHQCREHLDKARVERDELFDCVFPPSMPDIFRDTEVSKLHPKIQAVVDWKPSFDKSGLLVHGNTGVGKTRGIWEIVRRIWAEQAQKDYNMPFLFLTMRKLEGMIEKGFQDKEHAEVIDRIINAKLVVLDDFGKERLTSRMASDLFAVIDERSTARRTTLISTNFNGTALLERFENRDKETGMALVRRFRDYYRIVGVGVDVSNPPA
jgi:DNA replication protein DnaC